MSSSHICIIYLCSNQLVIKIIQSYAVIFQLFYPFLCHFVTVFHRCHPGEDLELCWQLRFPTTLAAGAQLQLRESREAFLSCGDGVCVTMSYGDLWWFHGI